MPHVISFGEALIDLFAGEGVALCALKPLKPSPGGAPANVAVGLARLGVDVGFVGQVGDDAYGHLLIELLRHERVDTSHFVADRRRPTMLTVVDAPSPTEQNFVLYHGADTLLRPEALDQAYIQSTDILIYGSVTLTHESGPAALQAAHWVRSAGRMVILDVNLRPSLWPDMETARKIIDEAVLGASVVKLNASELEFLTGTSEPEVGSQALLARGIQLCCVSLGASGSFFNNGGASGYVPPFRVPIVDTTGSGDAFVAGLACQLVELNQPLGHLRSAELRRALRFANACGALAATEIGAMSALPTRQMVDRLLSQQ
ncbi:MAG: carbohydrate kinase family protein [Anaerolineae bacterium]